MAALLITYDLQSPGQRHTQLLDAIKKFPGWAKLSESSYAVSTQSSPQQVYDYLAQYLDANDNLYVINLTRPYYGRGPQDVNEWLAKNLP